MPVQPDELLERDLERTLLPATWEPLRGARLFITGGTGFVGRWLLESFARANERLGLDARALVLTRSPESFAARAPHLAADPAMAFLGGDVRTFDFPPGEFSHVIHAATTNAVETFNNEDALAKFDTVALGTRRALEFAGRCGARKFLLVGSGAVYGKAPAGMKSIREDYLGAPCTTDFDGSALGEGKRAAELFAAYFAARHGFDLRIARCFSLVGPYLPTDIHYAIGNFIRDALFRDAIRVNGDGSPIRSYLYVGDLVVWLITLLARGKPAGIYNVGSDRATSIRDLAEIVRDTLAPGKPVVLGGEPGSGVGGDWYVPNIDRARGELALDAWTALPEAIRLTAATVRA
jgi:dTDP-glucose 4,6-dehydratase/UDP-glucose 4-epimerase